jgi:hypothetical protein
MRRAFLLVFVTALVASCNWPMTSTGGAGTTGTGGGSVSVCPQTSGCAACTQCALASPCQATYQACLANSSCQAVDQCYAQCNLDVTCEQACLANNPAGAADYAAVTHCVDCTQCPTACAGLCM